MRSRTMKTIKIIKHSDPSIEVHGVNVRYFSIDIHLILLHHIRMPNFNLNAGDHLCRFHLFIINVADNTTLQSLL